MTSNDLNILIRKEVLEAESAKEAAERVIRRPKNKGFKVTVVWQKVEIE
jgi:hypothetical protein